MTSVPLAGDFSSVNRYLKKLAQNQIRLAFEQSEKEVADLHQRVREGLVTARLAGKRIGTEPGRKLNIKKSVKAKEQIRRYSKAFEGTLKDAEVIKLVGLAPNTYYKYKRALRMAASEENRSKADNQPK